MKTITTFLIFSLCIFSGLAQSEISGNPLTIPERTPALEALYQVGQDLVNNGTAAQINANRLAIKNAWLEVDPAVAALYKPLEKATNGARMVEREISLQDSQPIQRSPDNWTTDILLREGYIGGLDMDTTLDGDIYIAAYENYIGNGSALYVYRSTDGGTSFVLYKEISVATGNFSKVQVIAMDGVGDDYLLVYVLFEDPKSFEVAKWNMSTGIFDADVISVNITDFSVDRNYVLNTSDQRVFGIYTKESGATPTIYSARSTAGQYGLEWVDEVALPGSNLEQIAFAYGSGGACYTSYKGVGSGNLYALPNLANNDPASWVGPAEIVVDGAVTETQNPVIRAASKSIPNDEVLIIASSRAAGSTDNFIGQSYRRENQDPFVAIGNIGATSDYSIVQMDSWITRRNTDDDVIQTSYVLERIDGAVNNSNFLRTYNGTDFDPLETVADIGINVFRGFPSAVAETNDGLPCMTFAGSGGNFGYNLYFDRKSTLGVDENNLEGFTFYPNPASDIINLSAKNTIENVSIYSLLGQEVMKLYPEQNNSSINISSLATGIYVMKVEMDGQIGTYKISKE